jgi:hypothetical protein
MSKHKDSGLGNNHILHNWEYADETARLAADGFEASDVGKLARQLDDGSYWELTAVTPTWAEFGSGGGGAGGVGDHEVSDAATDSLSTAATLKHNTSGTPVAGFGVDMVFQAETSTTEDTPIGRVGFSWRDATHASRSSRFAVFGSSYNGEYEYLAMTHPDVAPVSRDSLGNGAVDMQVARNLASEVASGNYSSLLGGYRNTASGNYSSLVGGKDNAASEYGASVFGGRDNTASQYNAGVFGGGGNTASGYYSGVLCGNNNSVSGNAGAAVGGYGNAVGQNSAVALGGYAAVVRWIGQVVNATGNFAIPGDAQGTIQTVLRRVVTHSTTGWTRLWVGGDAGLLTIPADTALTFIIKLVGTTQGMAKVFSFIIEGAIKNDGGTTTLLASTVTTVYDTDDTSFDARVVADDTGDSLSIEVSDSDGGSDVVRWVATIQAVEVSFVG